MTLCKLDPATGSFLAIDLKPSCFEAAGQSIELPEQATYFLVDQEGVLLYYLTSWNYGREELQAVADGYRETAVCDRANHVSENIKGSDGIVRNVFFHHMDNGWTGIPSSDFPI